MSFVPSAKIYQTNGTTLVYNIGHMIKVYTSGWPDDENPDQISLENLRSQGKIIIPGGNKSSEIIIGGRITADNYEGLMTAFEALKSAIQVNTNYYLKIDTSSTTTDDLKVAREKKIEIANTNYRTWLYYRIPFSTKSWN